MTRRATVPDDVYLDHAARTPPPPFESPYELDPNCAHAVLIERTPDFVMPAPDWSLPMGGFVLRTRDWQCTACLGVCLHPWGRTLIAKTEAI